MRLRSKIVITVILVLAIAGSIAGIKTLQIKSLIEAGKSMTVPPETISTTIVVEEKWQDTLTAIGSVTAVQGVTLTPEIPGIVREITFESGTMVAKGDLLARLDTSSEEAQLRAITAQLELANINLDRNKRLFSDHMVSQADLDTAESTMKQMQGNADVIRATIEKKTIRAPFAGQLGIRQINLGQYIDIGKPIVSLQSLAPVYVDFSLPQQNFSSIHTGMVVRLVTDAFPGKKFEATLTAINPDLDQSTRSVALQATFSNPEQLLRPGMFARAEVLLPSEKPVLAIPSTAILSAPFGDSVYIIESKPGKDGKEGLTVRQQFVRVGRSRGDFLSVESGLKPGEKIASSALFKLRNGMSIVESKEEVPKVESAPSPSDS